MESYAKRGFVMRLALKILLGITLLSALGWWIWQEETTPLYFGCAIDGEVLPAKLQEQAIRLGMTPQIIEFYLHWPQQKEDQEWNLQLLKNNLAAIQAQSSLPCLTWEPFYLTDGVKTSVLHRHLIEGTYDPYILAIARVIQQSQGPLILRFAHEMNLNEYHWGAPKELSESSPLQYIAMYQYVHKLFASQEVTNVLWAYCPNSDSLPNTGWNTIQAYYPGDNYVDILGLDGYNWYQIHPEQSTTQTFSAIFKKPLADLRKLNKQKPVIIFETASAGSPEEKKAWLRQALLSSGEKGITGLIWFDVQKEADWTLPSIASLAPLIRQTPTAIDWARDLLKKKPRSPQIREYAQSL